MNPPWGMDQANVQVSMDLKDVQVKEAMTF